MKEKQSLWGPAIGTLAFVLIVPGTVIVGVPYLLTDWEMGAPFLNLPFTRWIGALLFLAALPLFLQFLVRFVAEGRGTPAPVAPTKRLVVGGPFRWVRNPGYIAVLGLIVGEGLFLAHTSVLIYATSLAVVFHLFVSATMISCRTLNRSAFESVGTLITAALLPSSTNLSSLSLCLKDPSAGCQAYRDWPVPGYHRPFALARI